MKFDRSNKFDLCYYGQVNSLGLKSRVVSKWSIKHPLGNIYFAGAGTYMWFTVPLYRVCVIFMSSIFQNLLLYKSSF